MDEIEDIKHRLDIVEIIGSYLTLKKAGVNYKGLCPFHQEKSPSFLVSAERQTFKCFGCGEGGDIFTFIEKMEGLDFFNALKILADRAGVQLKQDKVSYGNSEYKADKKTRLFEINDWAKKVFVKLLSDHEKAQPARKYLKKRGLSEEAIKNFEIGYAPVSWDFLLRFLKSKGYKEDELFQAGVVVRNDRGGYYDRFRGRIMFPISNVMGHVVGFTSRVLEDNPKEAKYLNSSESAIYHKGEVLYGLDKAKMAIKEADLAVFVEGQMDVIACHQSGFKNVVASSGTAVTEQQLRTLSRYASVVGFSFDRDEAGETAMKRAITLALQNDVSCKIVSLSGPYKDPDEAIKADPKNWTRAVEQAKPALEFWIDLLVRKNPDLSVIAKKKIAKEILPVIKLTYSDIEKESYLKYLSKRLSVSEQSLLDALGKTKADKRATKEIEEIAKHELSLSDRLAALLWHDSKLIKRIPEGHKNIEFTDLKEFGAMVADGFVNKELAPQEEKSRLDQLVLALSENLEFDNPEALQSETDYLIKRISQEEREDLKNQFASRIRQAEEDGNKEKIKELLAEYARLIK
ncbi:MAG: DNA primase [Patescibacteria group bacterium]|jgi:DNA primase